LHLTLNTLILEVIDFNGLVGTGRKEPLLALVQSKGYYLGICELKE